MDDLREHAEAQAALFRVSSDELSSLINISDETPANTAVPMPKCRIRRVKKKGHSHDAISRRKNVGTVRYPTTFTLQVVRFAEEFQSGRFLESLISAAYF